MVSRSWRPRPGRAAELGRGVCEHLLRYSCLICVGTVSDPARRRARSRRASSAPSPPARWRRASGCRRCARSPRVARRQPDTVAAALAEPAPPRRGRLAARAAGTRVADRPPLRPAPCRRRAGGRARPRTGNPDPALLPAARGRCAAPAARLYGAPPVLAELAEVARAGARAPTASPPTRLAVGQRRAGRHRAGARRPSRARATRWRSRTPAGRACSTSCAALGLAARARRGRRARACCPAALVAALRAGARGRRAHPARPEPHRRGARRRRAPPSCAPCSAAHPTCWWSRTTTSARSPGAAGTRSRPAASAGRSCARCRSGSAPTCGWPSLAGDELTLARVEGRQSLGPGWVSGISSALAAAAVGGPGRSRRSPSAAEVYATGASALVDALAAHGIAATGAERPQRLGPRARRGRRGAARC